MCVSVSVVIPTYNGARFLADALSSIRAQTTLPREVIVVDDCSLDDTVQTAEALARGFPVPLRLIRLSRNSGGPPHPMNVGIEAAQDDLIVLLDQDDMMARDRIERLHAILMQYPDSPVCFGRSQPINAAGVFLPGPLKVRLESLYALPHTRIVADGLLIDGQAMYAHLLTVGNCIGGGSNIALRKSAWESLGGFRESERIVWDYDFLCKATRLGPIGFTSTIVNYYRQHPSSLSAAHSLETRATAARISIGHLRAPLWQLEPADTRRAWRRIARESWSMGYEEARGGRATAALRMYWQAVRSDVTLVAPVLWGACKLPAHWFLARFRRPMSSALDVPARDSCGPSAYPLSRHPIPK
jgi:GT2 family glycosyltransferase